MKLSISKRSSAANWRPGAFRAHAACAAVVIGLALGGCVGRGSGDITGSINRQVATMTDAEKRVAADQMGRQYDQRPGDKRISMTYARLLRDLGQHNQAIAVLQTATVRAPGDRDLAAAYGKALADGGRFQEALDVLSQAHSPDRPDWRILSTQGAVADQMGRHQDAQQYYTAALQLAPGEPTILSNLGLSYALSNRLTEAEPVLRQAVAHPQATPRMRGNLALVLALKGRFQDAEQMASKDLAPADAQANVTFVRSMTAQQNSWRQLQGQAGGQRARAAAARPPAPAGQPLPRPIQGRDG